jgi:predicted O-methyltransferase YrrM
MIENRSAVEYLRDTFGRGPHEHEHNCAGSLGYGWVHYGLIRAMRPERVLAIGSRHGFIPACMAAALKDNRHGRMDFVDANYNVTTDGEQAAGGQGWWTTHSFGDLDGVTDMHLMRTDKFFPTCKHQYAYIHIDGGHTYDIAKYDFAESARRLAPDGVIAMHDAINQTHPTNEGPGRVIQDVACEWDIIRFPGTYGLVIMQRKP